MKNTNSSGFAAARLKQGRTHTERFLWSAAVGVLLGFLLPRATIYGEYAPFGLGLAAAVNGPTAIPVFLSVFIGYLINGSTGVLRYLAALITVIGLRWSVSGFPKLTRSRLFAPTITFIGSVVTGSAILITDSRTFTEVVLVLSESLLAGGFAYFCACFFSECKEEGEYSDKERPRLGTLLVICVALMALFPLQWQGISAGRILSVTGILLSAYCGGIKGGSITGGIFSLTAFLTDPTCVYLVPIYAFGGLLAGLFSKKGRIACSLSFAGINVVVFSVLLTDLDATFIVSLYEIVVGAVFLFMAPAALKQQIRAVFAEDDPLSNHNEMREAVAAKMALAAKTMSSVAGTVDTVSKQLSTTAVPSTGSMYQSVADEVCARCRLRLSCWEKHFSQVMDSLNHATPLLDRGQQLAPADMGGYLKQHCQRLPEMCDHINNAYREYLVRAGAFQRLQELRGIVNDQFENTAQMLREFSQQFTRPQWNDKATADEIHRTLKKERIPVRSVACCIQEDKHMDIELWIDENCRAEAADHIRNLVEECCGRCFSAPTVEWNESCTHISFSEGQRYRTVVGTAQLRCKGEKLCGDAFEIFRDGNGHQYIVLSDGMGCGGRAAVDGAMTAGLTAELLKAGFGYESILRIVNTALMAKSEDETLATLDIACINLFTGELEMLKAGAGVSLLLSKTRVSRIEDSSLPLGILRELTFARTRDRLVEGDVLLLMSDGISNDGIRWVEELLQTFDVYNGSVQALSATIAETARKLHQDDKGDDMTVIAVKIEKNDDGDIDA